jgi:hypothetical protein
MSKSVEARLKETEAAKVALETEVTKLASENDTYTNRMKEMEDSITKAMKRMAEMEEKMEGYAKMKATLDEKMIETAATLTEVLEEKKEETTPVAENVIEGVNPNVVTGQPKEDEKSTSKEDEKSAKSGEMPQFIKDKIEESKEDAKEAEEDEDAEAEDTAKATKKGKKAKKAEDVTPSKEIADGVIEALVNEKVGDLASKFAMANSKFNELDAEIVKAKETLALEAKVKEAAMATISGLSAKYEALLAKITGIESSSKTVEEKVAQTVANLGVEPVASEALPTESSVKEKSAEEILAEFDSIEDVREKRAFYKKHESTIQTAAFPKKR